MHKSLDELDGVFTYIAVTKDELGVAKDELAAKPLVLYESDDLVALASEEIAIRAILDREIDTYDPYEREVPRVAAVGERKITYDARGLAEPFAEVPKISEIDGRRARFDAKELTTRTINLELRWLLYEEGVKEVEVDNPRLEALARGRHPHALQDHLQRQPRLLRLRPDRRPGDPHHRPGRLVGLREHDVGRRRRRRERGLAHGRGDARRRPRREGPRRRAQRGRPEGRHDHHVGSAGSMTGFMMQRGRIIIGGDVGPGLGDSMYDGTIYVAGKVKSLGIDCVPGEWTDADTELDRAQVPDLRARFAARVPEVRLRQGALQLRLARACGEEAGALMADETAPSLEERPRAQPHLHAGGHQRHPHQGRARPLPDARLLDLQADAALGRARLPPRHADPLRHRGLPREVRDEDGARRALREEAARARHPDLHHGHVVRRAEPRGEDGAREGRLDGGHGDLLGRGRDDPAGARLLDEVVLPGDPEAVRVQPAPPDARGRDRVLHRPGLQGRPRRAPDGPEGDGAGRGDALAPRGHRPALAGAPSRTGSARTTSR